MKFYIEPHVSDSLKFIDDALEWIDSVGEERFDELVVSSRSPGRFECMSSRLGMFKADDDWDGFDVDDDDVFVPEFNDDECWEAEDKLSLRETLRRYFARAFWNHTCKTRLGKLVFSAKFFKSLASEKGAKVKNQERERGMDGRRTRIVVQIEIGSHATQLMMFETRSNTFLSGVMVMMRCRGEIGVRIQSVRMERIAGLGISIEIDDIDVVGRVQRGNEQWSIVRHCNEGEWK